MRTAVHSVGDVTKWIQRMFKGEPLLKHILVRGEISNFSVYASGHAYFTLKDKDACLKCAMFSWREKRVRFSPEDGMQVIAGGTIGVYESGGVYQLYVETLIPEGTGALAAAFAQLKERLAAEGLFDGAHKKPLPFFPRCVGIVTSASGAVLHDIRRVAKRRFPGVRLALYPVQVQGAGAAEEVAAGVRFFNERFPVDVMIVGRGGGSAEDLWAFNEEPVVRAIYASEVPVISAVGHETDVTLADFAADVRAATPSQAAELAVPDAEALAARVGGLFARLRASGRRWTDAKRSRLSLCLRRAAPGASAAVEAKRARLLRVSGALSVAARRSLQARQQRLDAAMARLELLDPIRLLRRGYGIVEDETGGIVRSVRGVREGGELTVILADGRVRAAVRGIDTNRR